MMAAKRVYDIRDRQVPAEPVSRGRTLTAPEVAELVCAGKRSAKWVIQRMGPTIGSKPGRNWFFSEHDARRWWNEYVSPKRRTI